VVGYVIMPEHVHLLLSEPEESNHSVVLQVLKQRFARELLERLRKKQPRPDGSLWNIVLEQGHVWQRRFYDFVVWNRHKRAEKLRYMHENPVRRGLVASPEEWRWSRYRAYAYEENGPGVVNEQPPVRLKRMGVPVARWACAEFPPLQRTQGWGSRSKRWANPPHTLMKRTGPW